MELKNETVQIGVVELEELRAAAKNWVDVRSYDLVKENDELVTKCNRLNAGIAQW